MYIEYNMFLNVYYIGIFKHAVVTQLRIANEIHYYIKFLRHPKLDGNNVMKSHLNTNNNIFTFKWSKNQ